MRNSCFCIQFKNNNSSVDFWGMEHHIGEGMTTLLGKEF